MTKDEVEKFVKELEEMTREELQTYIEALKN